MDHGVCPRSLPCIRVHARHPSYVRREMTTPNQKEETDKIEHIDLVEPVKLLTVETTEHTMAEITLIEPVTVVTTETEMIKKAKKSGKADKKIMLDTDVDPSDW